MTSEWPWTLQGQKYLAYTEYFTPEAQILVRFALYDQPFLRYTWYKVVENQNIGNAPNDLRLNLNT